MKTETTPTVARLRARWAEQYDERPPCPAGCVGAVWHDGGRLRKATLLIDGVPSFASDIAQRRNHCRVCGKSYTHDPEAITSRAHYQPCVVSRAITELGTTPETSTTLVAAQIGCVTSTVRRWVERVAALAEPAQLASRLVQEAGEPVLPAVPLVLAAPQRSPRLGPLLLRALAVLVLLEALASIAGYAPPALAHAAYFIPANAPSPRNRGDPPLPS